MVEITSGPVIINPSTRALEVSTANFLNSNTILQAYFDLTRDPLCVIVAPLLVPNLNMICGPITIVENYTTSTYKFYA